MLERLVALSDLHLAPPGPLSSFRAGAELVALVEGWAGEAPLCLLLNGDTFDTLKVEGRPEVLDLAGAPAFLAAFFARLQVEAEWGARFFAALGNLVRRGGEVVVVPGNHDLELYHPGATVALRQACGLGAEEAGLRVHTAEAPWQGRVGGFEVLAGHGHLGDAWNALPPREVHRALERGDRELPLPPGSRLVLETVNAFCRACDPHTGRPRFPFVETLQPSAPWVVLVLLALDPRLVLSHLPGFLAHLDEVLPRELGRKLRRGATLAGGAEASAAGNEREAEGWLAELVGPLAEAWASGEKPAPATALRGLEDHLAGAAPPRPGTLAAGGARRWLLRAALAVRSRLQGEEEARALGAVDRGIVDEHLPAGVARRVVLAGHTHTPREHRLAGERIYLNTGTWLEEIAVPQGPEKVEAWLQALQGDAVPRRRKLVYAEVTAAGAKLRRWPTEESA